jgi:hypothetical protein
LEARYLKVSKIMELITENRPVEVIVDEQFKLPKAELLDVLYELEDADGVEAVHYITNYEIARYLVSKQVAIKRPSGGYRLNSETHRSALIRKIEGLQDAH